MPRTISDIYKEYKIMPFLEVHMLRVAAVAYLICENFDQELPKDEIIGTCLLHDMGNIIKSRLDYFPAQNEPEGIEYWQKVKDEYVAKYGTDENVATYEIVKELKLDHLLPNIKSFGFAKACANMENSDFLKKICYYGDMRVAPFGVMSLRDRMEEGQKRYKGSGRLFWPEDEKHKIEECQNKIEEQIFAHCKIKPDDINDETVKPIIEKLRDFVVK